MNYTTPSVEVTRVCIPMRLRLPMRSKRKLSVLVSVEHRHRALRVSGLGFKRTWIGQSFFPMELGIQESMRVTKEAKRMARAVLKELKKHVNVY